jgi:hypothetical protein
VWEEETERKVEYEKLRLDGKKILIFIMRNYDIKGWS